MSVSPALAWPTQFCTFVTVAAYVTSIITSNVSQVDRLWTFLPTIYTAYFALLPLWSRYQQAFLIPYTPTALPRDAAIDYSPRALLMLGLVTVWMGRLSYNTWRRGLFALYVLSLFSSTPLILLQERRGLPLGSLANQNPSLVFPSRQPYIRRYHPEYSTSPPRSSYSHGFYLTAT